MEALRDNGLPVLASCGGVRACATCHVFVEAQSFQHTGALSDEELELLSETHSYRENQSRLSCQIPYASQLSGISVTLAPEE
jgi:2Fe-2S ferredoxin